jgi:hypothetical protein
MATQFDSPIMREAIKRLIRSQMIEKGVDYKGLALKLRKLGVEQTESTLRSKVNNASMGAQLFLFIQLALNTRKLEMQHVQDILDNINDIED